MNIFTRSTFSLFFALVLLSSLRVKAQSILNPNDSVYTYNSSAPLGSKTNPGMPANANAIAKWIRTVRLSWNTNEWKAYILHTIPFRLKFPKSYDPKANDGKTYPMLVFWHGAGEKGPATDNEFSLANGGPVFQSAVDNGTFDGYVLVFQSPGNGWDNANFDLAVQVANYMIANNKLDPYRIISNGLSAGGYGTWGMIDEYPNYLAAALPMSGVTLGDLADSNISKTKFTSMWLFQGGLDTGPDPNTAKQVVTAIDTVNGGNLRYTLYPNLGHGTWTTAWAEPDFWPFVNRAYMSNPWTLFGRTQFCPGDSINVTIGVAPKLDAYQWRKDGVLLSSTTNTIQATATGTYDCRVERNGVWSDWSHTPVVIGIKPPTVTPPITVAGLMSKVIPALDNKGVTLKVPGGYATYTWQQVGSTTTIGTDSTLYVTKPGNYIVQVTEKFGCSSSFSPAFTVIDSAGPNKPDPASSLIVSTLSPTSLELDWSQNPTPVYNETGFEIYQATQAGGPYKLVAITVADASRYVVTGLNAGTKYYYVIRAVDNTGAAKVSNEAGASTTADVQPPTAPGNLTITGTARNSVSLSWTASTDNVGVIAYDIYINGTRSFTVAPTQTTFTVDALTHAQTYAFTVKARDQAGNNSPASNQVSGQPLNNGLPWKYYNNLSSSLTKIPDLGSLVPAMTGWSPNVTTAPATDNVNFAFLWEGYITIPTTGTYSFRTSSDDGSKLYLGALNGTGSPYSYTGTAIVNNDGAHGNTTVSSSNMTLTAGIYPIAISFWQQGGGYSMAVSWKTPSSGGSYVTIPNSAFMETATGGGPVPAAPSNLNATTVSYKAISLGWTDNSTNESGFEIWRSTSATTGFTIVNTTAAGATSFIDSTVAASTHYYYEVRAVNLYGASAFARNYTEAEWKFNNNYTDSSGNNRTLTALNNPTFDAANKAEGAYSVKLNGTNQAITINNTGGFLQEAYSQRTIALWMKSSGTSGANRVIFDIGGNDNGIALVLNNNTLIAAIASGNVRASISTTYNNTNWNHVAVVYNGDTLQLYVNGTLVASNNSLPFHSLSTTTNGARIGQTNGTNALNTNGGLFGGWIDDFGVYNTAFGADVINALRTFTYGLSDATTQVLPVIPAAPTGLTATAASSSAINLAWTNNAVNALNYQVYRSNNNNLGYVLLATLPASAVSYSDAGLYANAQYYYKVNAVNAGGASAYSNEVNVRTPGIAPVIAAVGNQQARYGTTTVIPVSAVSGSGSAITLSKANMPAFVSLTDNGNGTGSLTLTPASTDQGNYTNLMLIATDPSGAADTSSFNLAVNNNYAPTLDSIANYTLNENDTVSIALNGHNVNAADTLTIAVSNLPNSFTLIAGANGSAVLQLHPGYSAAGVFAVKVTVNDNNGLSVSRIFTLTVIKKDPSVKIYARVQYATTMGAPWNNMTGPSTPNLVDQNGNTTAVGINFLQSWWMPFNGGPTTGNNSGVYPDGVLSDFWYFGYYGGPETAAVAVTGLSQGKTYNLTLYAGSNFSGETDNGTTIYTIGTQSQSLYVQNNTKNTVTFSSLSPDSTGAITVNMKKAVGTPIGYLNAIVITQLYDDGTAPAAPSTLTAQNVPGKGVQLNWIDSAYNETGYQLYRSLSSTGTYSLLGTLAPGTVSYLDSLISGTTTYFYTVRAVNSHGTSAYTDTASVTTTDRIPQLTPIADVTLKNNQSTTVSVTATDDSTDHVTLTVSGLPSFATFVDNGNGTGTISIQPAAGVLGAFTGITVTGTDRSDSSRSVSFNLYVVDANVSSTYVNMTNFDNLAPAPWNNLAIAFQPGAGTALSGLKDDGNLATGITVTLTDAWDGLAATGMRRRNGSEVYPESVERTGLYLTNTTARQITVTGLSTSKLYNFVFYNSDGTSQNSTTDFTIGGQTVSLNGSYNSNKTVEINGVTSDASGTVVISCAKDASAAVGLLSAMVIEAYTPGSVTTLSPADLRVLDYSPTNTVSLQWQDRASNETGYEVWRSTNGGSYSKIATLPAGTTSYVNSNLTPNTAYDYTVRAVNGTNFSTYSNAVRGYAYATTVFINFNGLGTGNAAPAPWNNLNWVYGLGATWYNFNDETGVPTNIGMVQPVKVDGMVSPGVNTGNNSGVFPDKVLAEGFGMFPGDTTYVVLNNLDLSKTYDITVTASLTNYPGENSTVYMVNGKTYLLNSLNNYTGTLTMFGLQPDGNGQLKISFTGYPTATFGLLGAMVIKGYTPSNNSIAPPPVTMAVNTAVQTATARQFNNVDAANSLETAELKAYPNPFGEYFTLLVPAKGGDQAQVVITDMSGRMVLQQRFENLLEGTNVLRIQPAGLLTRGMYIVRVLYGDKTMQKTIKLIKQ